jgi:competence protein ComEC
LKYFFGMGVEGGMLRLAILAFVAGVGWLQQQPALPDPRLGLWLLAALPVLGLERRVRFRHAPMLFSGLTLALALGAGFFYAAWRADLRLADQLPAAWEGRDIQLTGVVAALPQFSERGVRFDFDVEQVSTPGAQVPRRIQLFWFNRAGEAEEEALLDPARLHAGERWRLTVRLKRPHGTANPHGFDYEAHLLERGIRATGYIRKDPANFRLNQTVSRPGYLIERARDEIAQRMRRVLADMPYGGVLVALAIGDQGAIPQEQWRVFTRTGVNHLMSISGLHVTLFSGLVFGAAYWAWRRSARLTQRIPARKAALVAGVLGAAAYTLLTGFAVPAQRTLYMMLGAALATWSGRVGSPSRVLAFALGLVVLLDPWAVLAPGFWLSFAAVALILYVSSHRLGRRHWLGEAAVVQWAVTLGLIPLLLILFQQVSLVSPLANAVAIPLVSFVVVPLTLAGAFLPLDFPLHLAHGVMSACMSGLGVLSELPAAVWQQHAPPLWAAAGAGVGIVWLLAPRGFPARWAGAVAVLPAFSVMPPAPSAGTLEATVLDVGQGLAVVLRTAGHAVLYDTGPRFGADVDSGGRIILPYLRAAGIGRLDGVIVSHQDNDHAGGAVSVLDATPVAWVLSSLPQGHPILDHAARSVRCVAGQGWEWDGVRFEVLHPTAANYAAGRKGNDRGCVLKASVGRQSLLIAADIEARAERELLAGHGDELRASVLVVPHHGSRTSSTNEFVAAVDPAWAVFTVGYRNRFGHPKPDVVARYVAQGSGLLRTDTAGAIRFVFGGEGLSPPQEYRKQNPRYWTS